MDVTETRESTLQDESEQRPKTAMVGSDTGCPRYVAIVVPNLG